LNMPVQQPAADGAGRRRRTRCERGSLEPRTVDAFHGTWAASPAVIPSIDQSHWCNHRAARVTECACSISGFALCATASEW
jgi:hypothetical protein